MRMRKTAVHVETESAPETRSDLHQWVRERLHLSATQEQALLDAIRPGSPSAGISPTC